MLPPAYSTMDIISELLVCPFSGRQDKPLDIFFSLKEFWENGWADFPEPYVGWPEGLANCLVVIYGPRPVETAEITEYPRTDMDAYRADDPAISWDEYLVPEEFPDSEGEAQPRKKPALARLVIPGSPNTLDEPELPIPDVSDPLEPELPISSSPSPTPRSRDVSDIFSTSRHAQSSTPPTSPLPPSSPISEPATPPQALCTPERKSKSSGKRRNNKENVSPLPAFTLVTDRIAMRSSEPEAVIGVPSVLGKRRTSLGEPDESPSKKRKWKMDAKGKRKRPFADVGNSSEDSDEVESMLGEGCDGSPCGSVLSTPKGAAVFSKPTQRELELSPEIPLAEELARRIAQTSPSVPASPPPRKKKCMILHSVEVPTLKEVERARRLARGRSVSERAVRMTSGSEKSLKRSKSSRALFDDAEKFRKLSNLPAKKRKMSNVDGDSVVSSSPTRVLRGIDVVGSGRQFHAFLILTESNHLSASSII